MFQNAIFWKSKHEIKEIILKMPCLFYLQIIGALYVNMKRVVIFIHHYKFSLFQCSPAKQAKRREGGPAARGLRLSREGSADVHAKRGLSSNATAPAEARR